MTVLITTNSKLQKEECGEDDIAFNATNALVELVGQFGVADDFARRGKLTQHLFDTANGETHYEKKIHSGQGMGNIT